MERALHEAALSPEAVDFVLLHGTGTVDNDLAEARAVKKVFGGTPPPLSSIKGAVGHSLAAAGAIATAAVTICLTEGFVPATVGCGVPDAALPVRPLLKKLQQPVGTVMANAFGFGGNNASLVLTRPEMAIPAQIPGLYQTRRLAVRRIACITGAGDTVATRKAWFEGSAPAGVAPDDAVVLHSLSPRKSGRLGRLARLSLSMADDLLAAAGTGPATPAPESLFMGTGLGAMTETAAFFDKLYRSGERFSSPIDFVGSVHNAPAGRVAMAHGIRGPNLTLTGNEDAFEQALSAAVLLTPSGETSLLMAADEYHARLSPRLDRSVAAALQPADGGAAFVLSASVRPGDICLAPLFAGTGGAACDPVESLCAAAGRGNSLHRRYGLVMAGIPAARRPAAIALLTRMQSMSDGIGSIPVLDYRPLVGEFATAAALAAALAVWMLEENRVPAACFGSRPVDLGDRGILLLGLGEPVTAMEVVIA